MRTKFTKKKYAGRKKCSTNNDNIMDGNDRIQKYIPMSRDYIAKALIEPDKQGEWQVFYLIAKDYNCNTAWWINEKKVPLEEQISFSANCMFFNGCIQRKIEGKWYCCYIKDFHDGLSKEKEFEDYIIFFEKRLKLAISRKNGCQKKQLKIKFVVQPKKIKEDENDEVKDDSWIDDY